MTTKNTKREKIYDAITGINPKIIEKTDKQNLKKLRYIKYSRTIRAMAAVLALICICSAFYTTYTKNLNTVHAITQAQYPQMAPYPEESSFLLPHGTFDEDAFSKAESEWYDDIVAQQRKIENKDALKEFFTKCTNEFLNTSDNGDTNLVYSPINVYIALSMLAEITGGNSQKQILKLLESDSIETLREEVSTLWNSSYRNDGAVFSILANSIWLNEQMRFNTDVLNILQDNYYASAYQGKMGSDELNNALQEWLNTQTGGLLEKQVENIHMDTDTILGLASTVYFRAKWSEKFDTKDTEQGIFHSPAGNTAIDYMKSSGGGIYYWADDYSAISKRLENNGQMWFILPDKNIALDSLLDNEQIINMVLNPNKYENQEPVMINASIPKFDVTSQLELSDGLKNLGITDIFDFSVADFSTLSKNDTDSALTQAQHDTRVAIDEQGVTAATYTVLLRDGAGFPNEEIDFVVNRPFLFVITTDANMPLFIGVVNQPN